MAPPPAAHAGDTEAVRANPGQRVEWPFRDPRLPGEAGGGASSIWPLPSPLFPAAAATSPAPGTVPATQPGVPGHPKPPRGALGCGEIHHPSPTSCCSNTEGPPVAGLPQKGGEPKGRKFGVGRSVDEESPPIGGTTGAVCQDYKCPYALTQRSQFKADVFRSALRGTDALEQNAGRALMPT